MNEIGSEFWDIPQTDIKQHFISDCALWFLSGRVALSYILKTLKLNKEIKTAHIPSWSCDSMIKPFLDNGIKVEFYPVYFNGRQLVCEVPDNAELLLVMDYFGFGSNSDYSDYNGIVIRDLTHSLFNKQYSDADYYFGSVRKWCGVWTGGFAYGKGLSENSSIIESANLQYARLRESSMNKKLKYISKLSDDKSFLESFSEAELILDNTVKIESACDRDVKAIEYLDIDFINTRRRKNAEFILNELGDIAIFKELNKTDCPLFVPIAVENRDLLRKELIENKIYCPVHWPVTELHILNSAEKTIYEKEISLICDQRYSEEDMLRLTEIVKEGVNKC